MGSDQRAEAPESIIVTDSATAEAAPHRIFHREPGAGLFLGSSCPSTKKPFSNALMTRS